jgi:DNA repair exonuclease SbcCD ATPase subunit
VFGDEAYEFRIITEQKRNRTEARAVFVRDGEEFDALSSIGGGVVDVAAFALRVAVILAQDPVRRLLILDEPMKFVSAEYRPQVRALLETLADELDVQIVLVTHISDLELGKIVRITS